MEREFVGHSLSIWDMAIKVFMDDFDKRQELKQSTYNQLKQNEYILLG